MKMVVKLSIWIIIILLVGLVFLVAPVTSEMDCTDIPHWSNTNPPVNQQHVFCGEWNQRKKRPVGFHSRPSGENPATIGRLNISQRPNAQGLYGVRWHYAGHPTPEKFSTMFPDACNRSQVLKSIAYAAKHPRSCPESAPRWAKCGPNKPPKDAQGYCEASDKSIFTVAFATLKNSNKINTAFPIVE